MTFVSIMPHLWIIPLVAVALTLVGYLWTFPLHRKWQKSGKPKMSYGTALDGRDYYWRSGVGVIAFVLGLCMFIVSAVTFIPYNVKYWSFYEITGTMSVETNSFTEGTGDLSYLPVIYINDYPDPIVSDSSRIMTLDGRDVTLICTISWEPYGLDTTYCGLKSVND